MGAAPHPEDIKASIRKRYRSVAAFERAFQLPSRSVRDVLRGKSRPRIAKAIAYGIDQPLHQLFPARFSPNGDALSIGRRKSHDENAGAK